MKVQCDVCKGEEASVFCCADEAALCDPCDARIHSANKLAGKHRRYALHQAASPHQFPLCDICKEKRALLFCQEDRAILCRDCDAPIHDANELTRKHNRFLLTGIKLSPTSATAADATEVTSSSDSRPSSAVASSSRTATSTNGEEFPVVINSVSQNRRGGDRRPPKEHERPAAGGKQTTTDKRSKETATSCATGFRKGSNVVGVGADAKGPSSSTSANTSAAATGGGSSISEYLMKELPGWQFEDLLLDSSCCPPLHPATFLECLTPFQEPDLSSAAFPSDDCGKLPTWCVPRVPQFSPAAPNPPPIHECHQGQQQQGLGMMGLTGGDLMTELPTRQLQHPHQYHPQRQHHRSTADDGFTVPDLIAVHRNAPPPSHRRPRSSTWRFSA